MKGRKRGRNLKRPSREIFEMMYYNPSVTIYELSNLWKVRPQTIYNWASYYSKNK